MAASVVLFVSARGDGAKGFLNSLASPDLGRTEPMLRPSTSWIAATSTAVPVKNASSAASRSGEPERADFDFDAEIVRDLNDRVTRDSEENRMAGVVRDEPTIANEEKVFSGAFRD